MADLPPIDLDWGPSPPPAVPSIRALPERNANHASAAPIYASTRPRCQQHGLMVSNNGLCVRCQGLQPKRSSAITSWIYIAIIFVVYGFGVRFAATRLGDVLRETAGAKLGQEPSGVRATSGSRNERVERVVMYTTSTCPACRTAKSWMKTNNVPYTEKLIDSDETALAEYSKLTSRVVPTLVIDGKIFSGFSPTQVKTALATAP
jgi:glutaredoxin 3